MKFTYFQTQFFQSSDGILYSGKKSDQWFLIDPKTGNREFVMGKSN